MGIIERLNIGNDKKMDTLDKQNMLIKDKMENLENNIN